MRSTHFRGLVLAAAVLGGCDGGDELPPAPLVQQEARLESFESCKALEDYIEDTAVLQMRTQLESSLRWSGGWGMPESGDTAGPPTAGAPGGGAAPVADAPRDHTGTNNQVAGVHEADFVQNDGTRLFVLSGQRLHLVRTWPAESLSRASTLAIEGWPREMFLDEHHRLVIFSSVYEPLPAFTGDSGGSDAICVGMDCAYSGGNTTKVTTVDVQDMAAPRVVEQLYLPGHYFNARRVGSAVRLLMNDSFRWPQAVQWWVPYSPELYDSQGRVNKEAMAKAVAALVEQNTRLIRQQTLAQWLPRGRRVGQDGTRELGYRCQDFHRTNASTRLGLVTVATLDLDAQSKDPGRTSIVAEPGEVYASAEALYVASGHWWWWPEPGQKDFTYLHKFDTRQGAGATYVGSATVEGSLRNQFSLDEHQGVLRVATTTTERLAPTGEQPWGPVRTYSRVTTWAQGDGRLVELGRTPPLAPDERIQSARFLGPRGFVVTFRQVDPLFTLDLSDPTQPRVLGELKIPGFSTYLHPLDDNHLLGLGFHVPEDGSWQGRALKLSVFDVSDMTRPREKYNQLVGTSSAWSEAAFEHKAFNWFPAKKLLAIPFSDWAPSSNGDPWGHFVSDLRLFHVDTAAGLSPVGALSMADVYRTYDYRHWSWSWSPQVRRSVMADDYVYAITDAGIRVSRADSLQTPVATVTFPTW